LAELKFRVFQSDQPGVVTSGTEVSGNSNLWIADTDCL